MDEHSLPKTRQSWRSSPSETSTRPALHSVQPSSEGALLFEEFAEQTVRIGSVEKLTAFPVQLNRLSKVSLGSVLIGNRYRSFDEKRSQLLGRIQRRSSPVFPAVAAILDPN